MARSACFVCNDIVTIVTIAIASGAFASVASASVKIRRSFTFGACFIGALRICAFPFLVAPALLELLLQQLELPRHHLEFAASGGRAWLGIGAARITVLSLAVLLVVRRANMRRHASVLAATAEPVLP